MHDNLTVSSWVGIREGCSMQYRLNGRDDVEFAICGQTQTFEFVFEAVTLREFVELGRAALAAMQGHPKDESAVSAPAI